MTFVCYEMIITIILVNICHHGWFFFCVCVCFLVIDIILFWSLYLYRITPKEVNLPPLRKTVSSCLKLSSDSVSLSFFFQAVLFLASLLLLPW